MMETLEFQLKFPYLFHSMTEEADNLVAKLIEEETGGGSVGGAPVPSIPSGHKTQQQQGKKFRIYSLFVFRFEWNLL